MWRLWLCGRTLAVLTLLCLAEGSHGKGISFGAKRLIYLVNDDVHAGKELAAVKATVTGGGLSPAKYFLTMITKLRHQFLKLDSSSGKITLLRSLHYIRLRRDGTRRLVAEVKGCTDFPRNKTCARTLVFIVALRKNIGDKFVSEAMGKITVQKLINRIFPQTGGKPTVVTPQQLLRLFRRIPKEAANISLSAAKQDMIIDYIRKELVKRLGISGPDNINFDCLHVEKLFSVTALKKLLEIDTCVAASIQPTDCFSIHYNYRTFDGTCNNLQYTHWGAAGTKLERMLSAEYVDPDRLYLPKGSPDEFYKTDLPPVSEVSHYLIRSQTHSKSSRDSFSHVLMQWGQFLDHDVGLSPEADGANHCPNIPCDGSQRVSIPPCFPIAPVNNSSRCIMLTRSAAVCQKDPSDLQPREQINVLTAYIDGSQIYGSSEQQADLLRSKKDGLLKMIRGNLLSLHHGDLEHPLNLCEDMGGCFLSGDTRVNEQIGLASMHTLFNREHNRIARALKKINAHWDDEKIFQETRKILGAILQKITYEDFVPKILGKDAMLPYKQYQSNVHPGILNEFSTAAFRFGHSLIRPRFEMLDSGYNPTQAPLPLVKMFFNNLHIQRHGIEPILLGLLANVSQNVDPTLAEDLTDHLFERNNTHGLNLAALNIQRGRDHGLPGYNSYRKLCGLKSAKTFDDLSKEITDAKYRDTLKKLYKSPNDIDLWVAGLAEDPLPDATVGPTFQCIMTKQFRNLRDGDRFFYEAKDVFNREQLREIKKVTLSHIMCDNLKGIVSIQKDAFRAPTCKESRISCQRIRQHSMDLNAWKEHAPCYSSPCEHGGHCIPINGGEDYECQCPPHWDGKRCQYREHACVPSPCLKRHSMMCRSELQGSQIFCDCVPGHDNCEEKDFCKLRPCPKGYICQNNGSHGYECVSVTSKV